MVKYVAFGRTVANLRMFPDGAIAQIPVDQAGPSQLKSHLESVFTRKDPEIVCVYTRHYGLVVA